MSMLERAKAEGLKVTPDGKIVLPGSLSTKIKKEKAPKVLKEPKSPKEFKGISSKIASQGDTISNIANGLSLIKSVMDKNQIKSTYKVSTYKTELRVAFNDLKGSDFLSKMSDEEKISFSNIGWALPDKKDFLSLNIA